MSTFKYGNYSHTSGTVDLVNFSASRVLDGRGLNQMIRKTMTIEGTLIGDGTQSNLKSQIDELETAYSTNGKNAALLHDDGSTSSHSLNNSRSIGGVRVVGLSYATGGPGEYATQRTFTIELEADFLATNADNTVSFQDTVSMQGTGGPRKIVIATISGAVVEQTIAQRTPVRATQSGQAVGFNGYPQPAPPFSPANEVVERREITRTNPERRSRSFVNYTTAWSYSFISTVPLIGNPSQR